jgi:histone-lysine N-methyltransferase SETMAR
MLTIVWNPHGFHLIKVLEKGRKFNAMNYVTEMRSPLSEWTASDATDSDRRLIIHAYNARPHTTGLSVEFFEDTSMKTAPHPPYSSNITPSDFYLCGRVKGYLNGRRGMETD